MLVGMDVLVPIGEFSKMTHLSVKALRHYDVDDVRNYFAAAGYDAYDPT